MAHLRPIWQKCGKVLLRAVMISCVFGSYFITLSMTSMKTDNFSCGMFCSSVLRVSMTCRLMGWSWKAASRDRVVSNSV